MIPLPKKETRRSHKNRDGTRKVSYYTQEAAERAAKRRSNELGTIIDAYVCHRPSARGLKHWHIGKRPDLAKRSRKNIDIALEIELSERVIGWIDSENHSSELRRISVFKKHQNKLMRARNPPLNPKPHVRGKKTRRGIHFDWIKY